MARFQWRDGKTLLVHSISAFEPRSVPRGSMWGVEATDCGIEPPDGAPIYRDLIVTCALCRDAGWLIGINESMRQPEEVAA